jgi:glycosyltransferase involved in cell wall biosynthesis
MKDIPVRLQVGVSLGTFDPGRVAGSSTYIGGLLSQLARCRSTNLMILASTEVFDGLPPEVRKRVTLERLGKGLQGTRGLMRARRIAALALARWPQHRLADVVHYPGTVPIPRARQPTVVTLHDVQHHDHPQFFSQGQLAWRRVAYDRAARHATVVVTVSEHARARIVDRLGIPPDRVCAIPSGIDPSRFNGGAAGADDVFDLAALDLPDRYLFYPAGLWPHKNHERLLDALTLTEDADINLVLTGPTLDRLTALQQSIERRRLGRRVKHLGLVPARLVPALYRRAAGVIFPSLYEGFGAPPLEAMACGCPVASSRAGSLEEVCGGAALTFDPTSPEAIAAAMDQVVSDVALRRRLIQSGTSRAAGFTWHAAAVKHVSAYRRAQQIGQ